MNRRDVGRWGALAFVLGIASLRRATPRSRPTPLPAAPTSNADRAVQAYRAMQGYFSVPEAPLYREQYPHSGGDGYATLWPFSQALVATLHLVGIPRIGDRFAPDVADRLAGLARYWNPGLLSGTVFGQAGIPGYASTVVSPLGLAGDLYYDDNEWIGLALIQHVRRTEDRSALDRAEQLFRLIVSAWDSDTRHACPGGVFWTQAIENHDRNTVSTAPAAALGAHLYELTGQATYRAWAIRMDRWVNECLRAPNGLYWDHLDLDGAVERTQWSYNQGAMLGLAVSLNRVTDESAYLDRAAQIADAALAYYAPGDRLAAQPVAFNAIFFKNLLRLDAARPDPRYRTTLQRYVDSLWQQVDPSTGLLRPRPAEAATLLDQAALVQLCALLAWNPEQYASLA